jgi:hypothetical protein
MIGNFYQLYRTTKEQIADARSEARSGRKDAAREVFRFISNARIPQIISGYEFPSALSVDVALLKWELQQLEQECHPASLCDQTSDIKSIRASLDLIAYFVASHNGGAK